MLRRFLFFGLLSISCHISLVFLVTGLRHQEGAPLSGEGIFVEVWPGSFERPSSDGENLPLQKKRGSDKELSLDAKNEGVGTGEGSPGSGSGPSGDNPILAKIRSQIIREVRYPTVARRAELEGNVLIGFRIDPEGKPTSIEVVKSSGNRILDDEAVGTVGRAAPYPLYAKPLTISLKYEMGQ